MIQEIINYTKHLKENSSWIFEHKLKPSKGKHLFIELDKEGNHINWPPKKGTDWDYHDGKNTTPFLNRIKAYEKYGQRVGTRMDKVFDTARITGSKKFQIFSCSPYIVSFKKQSYNLIPSRLESFFYKAINSCLKTENKNENLNKIALVQFFKKAVLTTLKKLNTITISITDKKGNIEDVSVFNNLKDSDYIYIYLKNIDIESYKESHEQYLLQNLFNKSNFNSDKNLLPETYGLSGFYNGLNDKKPFLQHKTATPYKGISSRIQAKDTVFLNDFDVLLRRKIFPKPLPIFIDKKEFENSNDILKVFKENEKLSYSQIIKQLFKKNENTTLQNFYLLFFNYKSELEDFDFVSKFEYNLKDCKIQNIFKIKKNKELVSDRNIYTIFGFESNVVREIFNNSLVSLNSKTNEYKVKYFDDIKAEYVSGGEPVYQMILKYRKAFYDYIYKSKRKALNGQIWDEILWNNIIADLRKEKFFNIREKLNIWFSLYNFFDNNNKNRDIMASLIPQLTNKMREVANNDNVHFDNEKEFAFGAGQIIYFLLTKSAASDKKHSLLEPFLQKVKAEQLQSSIGNIFGTYKHEINFGQGRFERLAKEVLAYDTQENLKNYQRFLLAGYFAPPVIFETTDKTTKE